MFKKIEIWILYLVILLSFLFIIGFGILVRQELVGSIKAGWISKTALSITEIPAKIKSSLNGLKEPDRFLQLDGFNGIPNIEESYILLSRYDGDLKKGVVELVDLKTFNILHTWEPDVDKFNNLIKKTNEFKNLTRDRNKSRTVLRHPLLTNDGGLLFQHDTPLRKIDACSNLIFQNAKDIFHHSQEIDIDGNIWASSYIYPQTLPSRNVGRNILSEGGYFDDAIVKLSQNGLILYEKSVSEILIENDLEYLLYSKRYNYFVKDPIHINDIQPVNFDSKFWKKGDVFMSLRNQSMILLFRPSSNKIIWKGVGKFFFQHDVDILDNHRISLFNNNAKEFHDGYIVDGNNQVMIYDFENNKYSYYLADSLIEHDVRTPLQGRSEILPNGDLFIEESDFARTLYFNANGSLRWSHVNRAKNGNVYMIGWSRILYKKDDINIIKKLPNFKNKLQ
ncbi:arylsulfotransferase family protein [Gammaproteobacteria bacterium]|nr:arylsulfotransferase family protein [Gammaproteobacteria bacterium]